MNKISHLLLDIFLFVVIVMWLMLVAWWVYPYNPLEIKQPLIVLNENHEVQRGEVLRYSCVFKKNTHIKPTIDRRLVDGIVYSFPRSRPTNPVGDNDFTCSVIIPDTIPTGEYYLYTSACYQMNPIREVCVDYQTEEFNII